MVDTRSRRDDRSGVDVIHGSNAKRKRLSQPTAVEEEDDNNSRAAAAAAPPPRPPPPPLEDRPCEDLVQVFSKKYLQILVKEAVAAFPDLVPAVRLLGKEGFGACSIRAQFWSLEEDPPVPSTVRKIFGVYGKIKDVVIERFDHGSRPYEGLAFVLFNRRDGARKALEEPLKTIDRLTDYKYELDPKTMKDSWRYCLNNARAYLGSRTLLNHSSLGGGYKYLDIRSGLNEYQEPPPQQQEAASSEDDDGSLLEEEPIKELIEALGKDTLEGIVKDAMSKYPDFIRIVLRAADTDPAFRLIGVRAEDIGNSFSRINAKYGDTFAKYGEILDATKMCGLFFILFKNRSSAREALKQRQYTIGGCQAMCDRVFCGLEFATPTKVHHGEPFS